MNITRRTLLGLAPAFALALSSCTEEKKPAAKKPAITEEPVLDALATLPSLDVAKTRHMSAWMTYGKCLIEDGIFYGWYFVKGEQKAQLIKFEVIQDGNSTKCGQWSVLDKDHSPSYLSKRADQLYYVKSDRESGEAVGIARINTDGTEAQELYKGTCSDLYLADERLYFTDEKYHLVSTNLDGGDLRTEIEKEVFYTYLLDNNWLIFQDDADNESLHLYKLDEQIDIKLNDEPSYHPIITGSELFYKTPDSENGDAYHINRIDLSQWEEKLDEKLNYHIPVFTAETSENIGGAEFFIDDSSMWPANNANGTPVALWQELKDDAYNGYTRVTRYSDEDYQIEEIMEEGSTMGFMFHDRHTNYGNSIPWMR